MRSRATGTVVVVVAAGVAAALWWRLSGPREGSSLPAGSIGDHGTGGHETTPTAEGPPAAGTPESPAAAPDSGPIAAEAFAEKRTPSGPKWLLSGTVRDATLQRPFAGAKVVLTAFAKTRSNLRTGEEMVTTSGPDGGFDFEFRIPAERFWAAASAPGYATAGKGKLAPPGGGRVDFAPLELVRGAICKGRVVDSDTRDPVAGAVLWFGHVQNSRRSSTVVMTSGDDGRFAADTVTPGQEEDLIIEAPDHALKVHGFSKPFASGVVTDLGDIPVGRGTRLSGVVVAEDTALPVPQAQILLTDQTVVLHVFDSLQALGRADENGRFDFDHLPEARGDDYLVLAFGDGRSGWMSLGTFTGVESKEIELRVRPGLAATVKVVDPAGAAVAGAEVSVGPNFNPPNRYGEKVSPYYESKWPEAICAACRSVTGDRGEAGFPHLPAPDADGPCEYDVIVTRADSPPAMGRITHPGRGREATTEIVLHPARHFVVSGRVLDGTGAGIAGARLGWWGLGVEAEASTDPAGAFHMPPLAIDRETIRICATAAGFDESIVTLQPDRETGIAEVVITLQRGGPVSGRVVDQSGRPITDLWLQLERLRPRTKRPDAFDGVAGERTDGGGRFTFSPVARDPWVLQVWRTVDPHTFRQPFPTLLVHGGEKDIVFTVPRLESPAARLEARAVEATTRAPVKVHRASIRSADPLAEEPQLPVLVDGDLVTGEGVPPGEWILDLELGDAWQATEGFRVGPGENLVKITVPVLRPGRLFGRVAVSDGFSAHGASAQSPVTAANGAGVDWWPLPEMKGRVPLAPDGTFRFVNVPAGPFPIRVVAGALMGQATVRMPPDGDLVVEIQLADPGQIVFRGRLPDRATEGRILLRRTAGEPGTLHDLPDDPGQAFEMTLDAAPGRWQWQGVIRQAGGQDLRLGGEAEVTSGLRIVVDL